jgi:hypothetical protein
MILKDDRPAVHESARSRHPSIFSMAHDAASVLWEYARFGHPATTWKNDGGLNGGCARYRGVSSCWMMDYEPYAFGYLRFQCLERLGSTNGTPYGRESFEYYPQETSAPVIRKDDDLKGRRIPHRHLGFSSFEPVV